MAEFCLCPLAFVLFLTHSKCSVFHACAEEVELLCAQMVLKKKKKNQQPCFVLQEQREGAAWWNFTKWHDFQSNVAALKSPHHN